MAHPAEPAAAMIAWLNPIGLLALAAVAVPVLVHLLRRHRATRLVVPTTRFVPKLPPHAVRLRRPSDLPLLLVRTAAIVAAALACAGPLFLTSARGETWNQRLAKAVVVDDAAVRDARIEEILRAEREASDPYTEVSGEPVAVAIPRAANWLRQSPPARREIVIVSPFPHGSLSSADLSRLPPEIGIRFVRVNRAEPPEPLTFHALTPSGTAAINASADGEKTAVRYAPSDSQHDGLILLAPHEHAAAVDRLKRVVARAGAATPVPPLRVVVRFRGGAEFTRKAPPTKEAIAAAARLAQSRLVGGIPLEVHASGGELQVSTDVIADSLDAAAIVHAALEATLDRRRLLTHETTTIPDAVLETWTRQPGSATPDDWRSSDRSDARWFWLAALVLLGVEMIVRRARRVPDAQVHADAA